MGAYQFLLIDQQNAGVGFQVDPLGLSHHLETLDCDVGLVREAEPHEIEHLQNSWMSRIEAT